MKRVPKEYFYFNHNKKKKDHEIKNAKFSVLLTMPKAVHSLKQFVLCFLRYHNDLGSKRRMIMLLGNRFPLLFEKQKFHVINFIVSPLPKNHVLK